jgi:hypothetical protein
MSLKFWFLLTCFTCPASLQALENSSSDNSSLKQKVSQAIEKFEQTTHENWAYQIERYENEEGDISSSIEKHSPLDGEHQPWTLIRINGKKPTKKQATQFTDKKIEQTKNLQKGANYSIKLREIINKDSLELASENNTHMDMSFNVRLPKMGKDSVGKLKGNLSYNKEHEFIEKITIVNKAEFSPLFSANITDLLLTFSFIQINNSVLPHRQDMELKGTFAYFTEIDEVSTDTYSNYTYQGVN